MGVGAQVLEMLVSTPGALGQAVRRAQAACVAELFEELVEWVSWLRIQRGLAPATVHNYLDASVDFLGFIGKQGVELDEAEPQQVLDWQKGMYLEGGARAATRALAMSGVRSYFRWRRLRGLGDNIAEEVPSAKRERRMPRKYSRQQLVAMLASCDRERVMGIRDFAILVFILGTGARRMEVANLTLEQMKLAERVGSVRFKGKGAKERVVGFRRHVTEALVAWLAVRDSIPLVDRDSVFVGFTGRNKGRALGNGGLDAVIGRAFKRAKLRVDAGNALHVLRSTYATQLYDEGHDIETIRILMGHEDIETTRQYIAISDKRLKTTLSSDFMAEVTGEKQHGLPLWAQSRLGQG